MSADAAAGVVDPDSRVHGIDNLYVAGSSVFPTGGSVHPTLNLVALTVRLAAHLRQRSMAGEHPPIAQAPP
jgi:choline dehydrogenase-like flavoprotein